MVGPSQWASSADGTGVGGGAANTGTGASQPAHTNASNKAPKEGMTPRQRPPLQAGLVKDLLLDTGVSWAA